MNIKLVYPPVKRRQTALQLLMPWCRLGFISAGFILGAINLSTGGRAWSLIACWSMWLIWAQLISPDLVEYNRISQSIKLIINSCILLFLIDLILAPGWAVTVVPIVSFSALVLLSVLFFTDFETQRQNMFPMLFFCEICLIGSVIGMSVRGVKHSWPYTVLGAISLSLTIACALRLGKDLLRACRKHFSTK